MTAAVPVSTAVTPAVTVRVPAKVNVQLAVGGLRPDGFHDLANVFLAVGLYDHVTASPAEGLRITAEGRGVARVPLDGTNLAARAAVALAKLHGIEADVHLHIAKNIPVAGGMAGGSADAAGALVACDALWGLGTPRDELLALCADLGSDVPFSLVGGAALGVGRGDVLTPLPVGGDFHWVFAVADGGLSTPDVYRECDRLRRAAGVPALAEDLTSAAPVGRGLAAPVVPAGAAGQGLAAPVVAAGAADRRPAPSADPAVVAALASGDAEELAAALRNDLQEAALSLRPALAETLSAGRSAGALAAIVSGSGPTCAFLAPSAAAAAALAATLPGATPPAPSPAPGATILP